MNAKIDACGLSCPQPVVLAKKKMDEIQKGEFEIIVDAPVARDNICRLSASHGWQTEISEQDGDIIIKVKK